MRMVLMLGESLAFVAGPDFCWLLIKCVWRFFSGLLAVDEALRSG